MIPPFAGKLRLVTKIEIAASYNIAYIVSSWLFQCSMWFQGMDALGLAGMAGGMANPALAPQLAAMGVQFPMPGAVDPSKM